MEAIAEGVGNGLVQYGKNDCTYQKVDIPGQAYEVSNIINFPQGITLADIIAMRITQPDTGQLYKSGPGGALTYYMQNSGKGGECMGNPSDTFVYSPNSYAGNNGNSDPKYNGNWTFTDANIAEVLILVKK